MNEKAIPNIHGKSNSKIKIGGDVIAERIHLHQAIVQKMRSLGLCTSPEIVEKFKRWFLWDFCNVETSRALSLIQLKEAKKMLIDITITIATKNILGKYQTFQSKRDILKITNGQRKKITAIAKYSFKLSANDLKTYISKRIGREPYVSKYFFLDMTIQEADTIIKALEKWEAKVLINKEG